MRIAAVIVAVTFSAGLALAGGPAAADPVHGEWLTPDGSGKIRIAPCPGKPDRVCGAISWLKNPADAKATDLNNPDPALKRRPILGLPMIRDFKAAGPGRWTGGKIYDPNSGKTYDSKLSVNPNGTLKVEGCVLMVCQAQTWRRS
ncbi:DUF2147 domain-containing protein [Phenylobacterium sp. SCN 70-31]|mgnify:CR=1 FL=1|uniref:DUF2147 domain-containing protein n=1 Tax=Phenylobacterium sp. SCN 70-31 TaxID=1660129 RepID=UPI0008684006|nr:DUF2147 domain-containing protein [Phenylobacterium sp. SCN 70-31]ODT86027.1 MAG: hypothetical protein ABS78_18040 [Phenylobacterium sp. SCN 70-31]